MRRRLLPLLLAAAAAATTLAASDPDGRPDEDWPAYGPTHYLEMSDGVLIAVNTRLPQAYEPGGRYPTILEMSGYESGSADGRTPAGDVADETGIEQVPLQGGTRAAHGAMHDDEYVTVMMSLRGTGCSGGEFDLFSWRSALDGREVIDEWIARQPWSNGEVGIYGHSYSGITGTMVAATQPEHLVAASVSGLIGDLYRDIVYPGGVTNYGFPLLWTAAVRPAYDAGGGLGGGLVGPPGQYDPAIAAACLEAQRSKSRAVLQDPLVHGLWDQDSEWYRARSNSYVADRIEVPMHLTTAYQDEQTGPRGAHTVWDALPDDIHKRIVLTNGDHGVQDHEVIRNDGLAWLDYWLLDRDRPQERHAHSFDAGAATDLTALFGRRDAPTTSARVLLGYREAHVYEFDGQIAAADWPLPQTAFTDVFLAADGSMSLAADAVAEGTVGYLSGTRRQAYGHMVGSSNGGELTSSDGPDQLDWVLPVGAQPLVLAGPATATLHLATTATDTELYVQLLDRAPTGELLYLQRGVLKASHRAIAEAGTRRTSDGRIWRPFRPHTNPDVATTPGQVREYLVEVWPFAHVLQPGHELVVRLSAPPQDDNDWMYVAKTPPAWNTVHTGGEQPSRLMLPVVPLAGVEGLDLDRAPCQLVAMRCVVPGHRG